MTRRGILVLAALMLSFATACDSLEIGAAGAHGKKIWMYACTAHIDHRRTGDLTYRGLTYEAANPFGGYGCDGVAARLKFVGSDHNLYYNSWVWHYPNHGIGQLGWALSPQPALRSPTSYHIICDDPFCSVTVEN